MNPVTVGMRSRGHKAAALLGSASVLALGTGAAHAQVQEVLITGSLIAGTQAVGVPVTAVGEEQFLEQGAVTVSDMLFSVPSINVDPTLTALRGGGTTGYGQNVAIHGFEGSGGDAITLMLINGRRWPIQGHGGDTVDPSIIPQLAVERVDILTAGASAVYGADAIVGVINVILKRNYEGAVSQATVSRSQDIGQGWRVAGSHLHGISWDTGNVTLVGEAYFQQRVTSAAVGRDYYTTNFFDTSLGYDRSPISFQMPGVISLGDPAGPQGDATAGEFAPGGPVSVDNPNFYPEYPSDMPDGFSAIAGTHFCGNCYALPQGLGRVYDPDNVTSTTTWQEIEANQWTVGQRNEENQRINYDDAWALPQQQREAFVGTLNQVLTEDFFGLGEVELHGTMFYSNRKGTMHFAANTNSGNTRGHLSFRRADTGIEVPSNNPYLPSGVFSNGMTYQEMLAERRAAVENYTYYNFVDQAYVDAYDAHLLANPGDTAGAELEGEDAALDAVNSGDADDAADDAGNTQRRLRLHVNASPLLGGTSRISFENIATRYEFGFNFNSLPFGWVGDAFYSMSNEQNNTMTTNMINRDRAALALGATVSGNTKPENIPFLNPFCDGLVYGTSCNSQVTLDYIRGFRLQANQWRIRQMGINFSGPVWELPSGEIQAAVSFEHTSQHYWFRDWSDADTTRFDSPGDFITDISTRVAHAFFGQINIPIFGNEWSFPGMEALDLELGYRVDKFDFQQSYIKTPKVAATWQVGWGLSFRGAWGKSFRAPGFGQLSAAAGSRAIGVNFLGGSGGENNYTFRCDNPNTGQSAGTALSGSATEVFNENCITAPGQENLWAPAGIELVGGSGLGDYARGLSGEVASLNPGIQGKGLGPEQAKQYVLGLNFAPTEGIFAGVSLDVSYFHIKISDNIRSDLSGNESGAAVGDNPLSRHLFVIRPSRINPGADDSEFDQVIENLAELPSSTATFEPSRTYDFIFDAANRNTGFIELEGIDFSFRYDHDFGNWGSWHIGTAGYYELDQRANAGTADAITTSIYGYEDENGNKVGQNSGAQMKRIRSRMGWMSPDGTWSATLFNTWEGHESPTNNVSLPECFWREGYSAGSCYSGSPFFPQEHDQFYNVSPGWMQWDVNVTYNTGMMPANEYLQNINVSLTVNNFLNEDPPEVFNARTDAREIYAYDARFSELGRFFSLTLTKSW